MRDIMEGIVSKIDPNREAKHLERVDEHVTPCQPLVLIRVSHVATRFRRRSGQEVPGYYEFAGRKHGKPKRRCGVTLPATRAPARQVRLFDEARWPCGTISTLNEFRPSASASASNRVR
jgi:hypothetical protein